MIKIYVIDTRPLYISDLLSSVYLKESDLEAVSKYKVDEAKKEKAASFILKNKYIGDYSLSPKGKPVSENTFFNITHSHGVVMLAVNQTSPVGIDLEKIRKMEDDFKRYVTSDEEYGAIKTDSDFFKLWTNKESLLKAVGCGIDRKLPLVPGLPLNGLRQLGEKRYQSKTMLYEDFVLSITIEGDEVFEISFMKENNIWKSTTL